ncbi:MAG TPA: DUF4214 domain-containing protein [Noviherbaspirillum sp.]
MLRPAVLLVSLVLSLLLAACGGSDRSHATSGASPGAVSISAPHTFAVTDYHPVVQQLYVAYFGRPADPAGLANFAAELNAAHAPNDIQSLNAAYNSDPRIRSLIDSFGFSPESQALHTGDTASFVTAIYRNVLNRLPASEGLDFWVSAIDQRGLTRGNASFSIMAGALANGSPQGRLDALLINRRIVAATSFTASLSSDSLVNAYRGSGAAAIARNMLSTISESSDMAAIQSAIDATLPTLVASAGSGGTPPVPPAGFSAALVQAPSDDANLSGIVGLQVNGSGLGNVELLPESSYSPVLGRFTVSPDRTSARLEFDTRTVPNYLLRARIVAFDVPPGTAGARQIVVMPARSWWMRNSPPPFGTPEGRAARCLSSGRAHTRLSDPFPVVCIYETATMPYEQCKDGWGMLYANPEDGLPVLRDGRFVSKLYCEPGANNGRLNLGCSCT